jgi:hypothetical protein
LKKIPLKKKGNPHSTLKESNSYMIYKHKNKHKLDGVYSNYQGHEKPQEQKIKERSKSNFQTRNMTRLCD